MPPRKAQKVKRDLNAARRAAAALEYIDAGYTYEETAKLCGYSGSGAVCNAVHREMDRVIHDNVERLRLSWHRRNLKLLKVAWTLALGDPTIEIDDEDDEETRKDKRRRRKPSLFAMDRVLAIEERDARLMGLDVKDDALLVNPPQIVIPDALANAVQGTTAGGQHVSGPH